MRNVLDMIWRENQNTHFMLNIFFKLSHLWDNVEKYGTARQVTDDNTAHAHCMLHNWSYIHTLRISDYLLFFFHGKMVRWRPFTVCFCVLFLSCLLSPFIWWLISPSQCVYQHQICEATGWPRLQASRWQRRIMSVSCPETSVSD